jgi:hypothetical protein
MSGLDLSDLSADDLAPVLDEMARLLRIVPFQSSPSPASGLPPSRPPAAAGAGDSLPEQGATP